MLNREIDRQKAEIERLRERCEAYKGQVKAGAAEIERLRARAERLRLELEKIGWMDEFLDAAGARAMMNIAREAVQADEDSGQAG